MISNTTIVEVRDSSNLTNPIDLDRMYTIIYSGFPYEPFRVVITTALDECTVTQTMDINQVIEFLDIRKEFDLNSLFRVLPDRIKEHQISILKKKYIR